MIQSVDDGNAQTNMVVQVALSPPINTTPHSISLFDLTVMPAASPDDTQPVMFDVVIGEGAGPEPQPAD